VCEEARAGHGDMAGPPRGNPAHRHRQRAEKVDEVGNSKEGRRCRERAAAPTMGETLRRESSGQRAAGREERERGAWRRFGAEATRVGKRPRRGEIPRRHPQGTWLNPKDPGGTSAACQTLKWGRRALRRTTVTTGGGRRPRGRTATREEQSLEGRTPRADSG
jgi:hypothetical protein